MLIEPIDAAASRAVGDAGRAGAASTFPALAPPPLALPEGRAERLDELDRAPLAGFFCLASATGVTASVSPNATTNVPARDHG
ncbi:MAG TPA: hypothetical protein VKZ49_06740 [Polyangiaceae bacterium]|nr:hypothetical protein [Polyangiaceae bacterium]